jgi:hypothetical protein
MSLKNCGQLSLELESIFQSAQAMIDTQSPLNFLPPELPAQPWYFSPLLELPAGTLRQYGCGRILTADNFVLGVGMSANHYLIVEPASRANNLPKILDQAVGFLAAHGARITRVQLRCPMGWFGNAGGDFEWHRCFVYFVRDFLATDPTDPPWIPPHIWPVVPVGKIANAGRVHWSQIDEILSGVEAADRSLLPLVAPSLSTVGRKWEYYLARIIVLSERAGTYGSSDREAVACCDRLVSSVITRFAPDYEFVPATTTRLL